MIFLNDITFLKGYRTLPLGLSVSMRDLTVIVGDQGAGKSSLLSLLSKNDQTHIKYNMVNHLGKTVSSFFFDSESMNPRIRDGRDYTDINGNSIGYGVANAILSRWKSHGEVLQEFTVNRVNTVENSVLLLDEPESALSLTNQYNLAEQLKLAAIKNQIIISTHSLVLIQSVDEVYDLTSKKWMASKSYITSQKRKSKKGNI